MVADGSSQSHAVRRTTHMPVMAQVRKLAIDENKILCQIAGGFGLSAVWILLLVTYMAHRPTTPSQMNMPTRPPDPLATLSPGEPRRSAGHAPAARQTAIARKAEDEASFVVACPGVDASDQVMEAVFAEGASCNAKRRKFIDTGYNRSRCQICT